MKRVKLLMLGLVVVGVLVLNLKGVEVNPNTMVLFDHGKLLN